MSHEPWFEMSHEVNKILLVHGETYFELKDVERHSMLHIQSFLKYEKSFIKKYHIVEKIVDQNNNLILICGKVDHISY